MRTARTQIQGRGIVYGIATFALLAFVLPLVEIPHIRFSEAVSLVAYLLTGWSALRIARLLTLGDARLLETAFWTFSYSFLTLPLLAQTTEHAYVYPTAYTYSTTTIATGEILIILGFVGFDVGRVLVARRRTEHHQEPTGLHISTRRASLLGAVGLLFVAYAVARHGLATFYSGRQAAAEAFLGPVAKGLTYSQTTGKAAGTVLGELTSAPVFLSAYFLLYTRHAAKTNPDIKKPPVPWLAVLVAANLLVNNPLSNSRSWWVTVAIGFASIYLPMRERKGAARLFIVLFVVTSLFSFSQLAAFRRSGTANLDAKPLSQSLVSDPDYGSPQQILNGVQYAADNGYTFGKQLASSLLFFVPHSIWAGKSTDTGDIVGAAAGYNVSAPIWTEGWVDFGYVGTLLFLLIVGVLTGRLDHRYVRSRAPTIYVAAVPLMAALLVFVARGSLQPAFRTVFSLFVLSSLVYSRRPKTEPAPAPKPARTAPRVSPPRAATELSEDWCRALGI